TIAFFSPSFASRTLVITSGFKSIDKESSLSCCHLGLLSLRAMVVDSIQTLDPINT
ncbi:hypothetical protein HN873_036121, partial [Arachis hypogaea]